MQSEDRRQRGVLVRVSLALLALFAFWWPAAAVAQSEFSSQQAHVAQYVFVVDDSGSMRISDRGLPPADIDRLAVFAVRATLSMLDDRDEATVIRLNGPTTAAPIAPLSDNRARLEGDLRLNGVLAQYGGRNTYCERALDAAKQALNAAQRPGVAQVVMFLTDGRCEDNPTVRGFLDGLASHKEGLFSFYLLRFKGRDFSPALADLAKATEGEVLETSATDPTAILFPFASALTRSQGYEAYLLDPRSSQLDAHRGARRVRLLAVAPGTGAAIDFRIDPVAKGEAPKRVGGTKAGSHRYEQGRTFRYAALDYRPGTVPVKIAAANAGSDWKIVAVPEYRLFADLSAYQGACSARGPKVLHVEVGETVCVRVRLVNEDGHVVPTDIAGIGSQAEVSYQAPGSAAPTKLAAEREGDAASFLLEFAKLDGGFHVFQPRIRVAVPGRKGETITIAGASKTLQVTSTTARAEPSTLDFGTVVPGRKLHKKITLHGNFTPTSGTLKVQNREDVPECLRFELSGKAAGVKQALSPGQEYQVSVLVDPYCGPTSLNRAVNPTLQIEFEGSHATQVVPTVTVPLKLKLDSRISAPPELNVRVRAGRTEAVSFGLVGNFESPLQVAALLPAADRHAIWPNPRHLELALLDEKNQPIRKDGDLALSTTARFEPGGTDDPVRIRIRARACCDAGAYATTVLLKPAHGKGITVPLKITVEAASAWECWGGRVLGSLLGLLALLLLLYLYNIYRKTHVWSRKRLHSRLTLLEWSGRYADPAPNSASEVRKFIKRRLSRGDRVKAWLRANPLKLGLPGTPHYREVLRLSLNEPRNSMIRVVSEETVRNLHRKLDPSPYVYYQAGTSNGLFFMPSEDGHIGATKVEGLREFFDAEDPRPVNHLKLVFEDDKSDGEWAGWEIGS